MPIARPVELCSIRSYVSGCLARCPTEDITNYITFNRLYSYEDISHLAECKSLSVLDLANNRLDDPKILEVSLFIYF